MLSMILTYWLCSCTEFTTRHSKVLSKCLSKHHAEMLGCESEQAPGNGGGGEDAGST